MPIFKLLAGSHAEGTHEDGSPIRFKKGEVFSSNTELDLKFNSQGSTKFQRMPEGTPLTGPVAAAARKGFNDGTTDKVTDHAADLANRTVAELKKIAEEFEIDLGEATKKDDIIAKLVEAGV